MGLSKHRRPTVAKSLGAAAAGGGLASAGEVAEPAGRVSEAAIAGGVEAYGPGGAS